MYCLSAYQRILIPTTYKLSVLGHNVNEDMLPNGSTATRKGDIYIGKDTELFEWEIQLNIYLYMHPHPAPINQQSLTLLRLGCIK